MYSEREAGEDSVRIIERGAREKRWIEREKAAGGGSGRVRAEAMVVCLVELLGLVCVAFWGLCLRLVCSTGRGKVDPFVADDPFG